MTLQIQWPSLALQNFNVFEVAITDCLVSTKHFVITDRAKTIRADVIFDDVKQGCSTFFSHGPDLLFQNLLCGILLLEKR